MTIHSGFATTHGVNHITDEDMAQRRYGTTQDTPGSFAI